MVPGPLARIVPAALALVVLAPPRVFSTAPQTARTVVAIYWSSESYPGTQSLDTIIQDALQSRSERIDYFAEYLESDRFPDEQASMALFSACVSSVLPSPRAP